MSKLQIIYMAIAATFFTDFPISEIAADLETRLISVPFSMLVGGTILFFWQKFLNKKFPKK